MESLDYDVIVIGSGFGGAVTACRLAQAELKVLVLERGRKWTASSYPRDASDPWIWNQQNPAESNGWADMRMFSDMSVVAGAGVGGGSLIYANVSVEAKPEVFNRGWPSGITYQELKPHYDAVAEMLDVQEVPDNQVSNRTKLMQDAAHQCGWGSRFRKLPLAVRFNQDYDAGAQDPRADSHSMTSLNKHGVEQGTCVHCGNCVIGCQVYAKNTLDRNYLAIAERAGAVIRPLHVVVNIEALGGSQDGSTGWRVIFDVVDVESKSTRRGSCTANAIALGAGSIGTTELLLKCRDEHRSLPNLSPRLGHGWAFNGDLFTPAFYESRKISPSHGVTISAAIDLLDRSEGGQALFIEDGGIPNLAGNFILKRLGKLPGGKFKGFWRALRKVVDDGDPLENMMPWFGQAIDAGDGRLSLKRKWYAPWKRSINLDWNYKRSEGAVEGMISVHKKLSEATGGNPFVPRTWTVLKNLITPHPLGGCNMGVTRADGVVDHRGKVFGYEGLYVMDGAAVPSPLGLNPSRTIAALAERNVIHMVADLFPGSSAALSRVREEQLAELATWTPHSPAAVSRPSVVS